MTDAISRSAVLWITAETGALETQRRVRELPAIDAVPVVRCKDCRFYNKDTVSCSFVTADANWYEDDFCSYGERKDND